MARKYRKLKFEDRKTIEAMLRTGSSVAEVAGALGVHRDTIYKEFTRSNTDKRTYSAELAQRAI